MSRDEYETYAKARQASFSYLKGDFMHCVRIATILTRGPQADGFANLSSKAVWLLASRVTDLLCSFSAYVENSPSDEIIDVLSFLAYEYVAAVTERSLLLRSKADDRVKAQASPEPESFEIDQPPAKKRRTTKGKHPAAVGKDLTTRNNATSDKFRKASIPGKRSVQTKSKLSTSLLASDLEHERNNAVGRSVSPADSLTRNDDDDDGPTESDSKPARAPSPSSSDIDEASLPQGPFSKPLPEPPAPTTTTTGGGGDADESLPMPERRQARTALTAQNMREAFESLNHDGPRALCFGLRNWRTGWRRRPSPALQGGL